MASTDYPLGSDSLAQPGVPRGKVEKYTIAESKWFPGTVHDYWIYVPAQYDPAKPACVMVFQDGNGHMDPIGWGGDPNSQYPATVVLDNLINKHEMPVTVGIFISSGTIPPSGPEAFGRPNRSYEYDSLGDRYVRFLLDEILPEVGKKYNLIQNGNGRAITGVSSGGISSFNAAWERPDAFQRVFSGIGSFDGLRGGDIFPYLVRVTEPKPIRIFLEDGSTDLNIFAGNWWLGNQAMLSALEFSGYEVGHAWSDRGHDIKHCAAILPDVMRWLWKDYPEPIRAGVNSKQPVMRVLLPDESWKAVGRGYESPDSLAANSRGEIFFTGRAADRIYRIGLDGVVSVFADKTGGSSGIAFGPEGKLYACQSGRKRIVAYDDQGQEQTVSDGIEGQNVCVAANGNLYVTDPGHQKIWLVTRGGKRAFEPGITSPNFICLSPDQTQLIVTDAHAQAAYMLTVGSDGSLANCAPYFHLNLPYGDTDSGAAGVTVDIDGWAYFATRLGLQFADNEGRIPGIILKPKNDEIAGLAFGGAAFDELYVACGDSIYKRKTRATGARSFQPPIKPVKKSAF